MKKHIPKKALRNGQPIFGRMIYLSHRKAEEYYSLSRPPKEIGSVILDPIDPEIRKWRIDKIEKVFCPTQTTRKFEYYLVHLVAAIRGERDTSRYFRDDN